MLFGRGEDSEKGASIDDPTTKPPLFGVDEPKLLLLPAPTVYREKKRSAATDRRLNSRVESSRNMRGRTRTNT